MHFNEDGSLIWPVMFLYPEYGQMDLIEYFNENNKLYKIIYYISSTILIIRFIDFINPMFAEVQVWDTERKYTPDKIEVKIFKPVYLKLQYYYY